MGTQFFKPAQPKFSVGNPGLASRAIGAAVGAGRGSGIAAQKDLAAAQAINKSHFKPNTKSGAYPAGPKV